MSARPCGKAGRATDVEVETGDAHLRQTDVCIDSVVDAEISRIQLRIRRERDVDAVESQSRFVGQVWTKDVRFVQGEDLPSRLARVAQTRQRVSLKIRLAAFVALEGVVAVKAIVGAEVVTHVAGPLIDIDWRRA